MNKKSLVKIINQELAILTDFVEGFDKSGNIHPKEIDLTLSKVRDIYDELLLLKGDSDSVSLDVTLPINKKNEDIDTPILEEENEVESVLEKVTKEENPIIQESQKENNNIPKSIENNVKIEDKETIALDSVKTKVETKESEIEVSVGEKEIVVEQTHEEFNTKVEIIENSDLNNKIDNNNNSQEIKEQELVTDEDKSNGKGQIIADKFNKRSPSINDMLSGVKNNKNLASLLHDSPIKDLKKAIKLNDRIWYVSELFSNNSATYEKTVDVVNKSEDLDQALEYIFDNFKWDQEKKSTISFLELVFRRFANN